MTLSPIGPTPGLPAAPEGLARAGRLPAESGAGVARSDAREESGASFGEILRQMLRSEGSAQRAVEDYSTGKAQNLHETMIALEKADISFSLLVSVRNKLLDAYREVMRMS
jgi:flagellar hook-basal body complex protein FliE